MSVLINEEISLLVTSNPAVGAINRSPDGANFEIQLEDPLTIPKDAMNVKIKIDEAKIWWTVPNIIAGVNDTFYIFGDDDQAIPVPQNFVIQIPQGLYDLTGLNNALQSGLEAAGARTVDGANNPLPLLSLLADEATQKVLIRFNYPNVTADFTQTNTPREIIGADVLVYGPYAGAPLNVLMPNVAAFNQVNSFLIASDLVQKGIRVNNRYNQIIADVGIDVSPGSQIVFSPRHPAKVKANELIGAKRTNIRFRLTDDQLRPVNTNGEFWSSRFVISYDMPIVIRDAI